jgi:N-acetylmuramoyl-L-alanine amidase
MLAHKPHIRLVLAAIVGLALAVSHRPSNVRASIDSSACFNPTATIGSPTAILDPGHGGTDTGATNGTLTERDINLDIAFHVRDQLVMQGLRVCMTRTQVDPNWTNTQRAQYANSVAQADGRNILVLIHLNSSSNTTTDYTKTYWGKKLKDLNFAKVMYNTLVQRLITQLSAGTCAGVNLQPSSVGQFADGALLKSNMPATLTENVFLSNAGEARCFTDTSVSITRQQEIANALAAGILTWFSNH